MKKLTIFFVLACLTTVLSASAFAAPSDCFDGGSGLDCDMLMSTLLPSISTYSVGMKEAYVAQVHDAAAEYVAADGQEAASAVLEEAIRSVRARYSDTASLSDLDIAKILMN